MKRFHVHVAVPDLEESIRFYSTMFGAKPTVVKEDYAKWMLDEPRVNFAISKRGSAVGINHLGFQADDASELQHIRSQFAAAGSNVKEETDVACCYARSDKYWVTDPAGIAWESFHTLGTVPLYNGEKEEAEKGACCPPSDKAAAAAGKSACCGPGAREMAKSCC